MIILTFSPVGLPVGGSAAASQLIIATGNEITSLDPHTTDDTDSQNARFMVYETLLRYVGGSQFAPGLATSWTVSEGGKKYRFSLRKGVRFHDGTPFDAEAVKVNLDRLLDPKRDTPAKDYLSTIKTVTVVDDSTVEIELKEPFAPFLANLATGPGLMLSPEAIKKYGAEMSKHAVGTGAFTLVEWVRGDHLTFAKNNDYWGTPPKVDRVVIRLVPEGAARVAALKTGEAQVVLRVPPADAVALQNDPSVNILRTTTERSILFVLNMSRKPFSDIRVRKAINEAVNRSAIVNGLMRGAGTVMDGPIAPGITGATRIHPYPYDPSAAKQLLTQAGYAKGVDISAWCPSGRYVLDKEVCEAVQGQVRQVGIQMKLRIWGDWPAYIGQLFKKMDADMAFIGVITDNHDADTLATLTMAPGSLFDFGKYQSAVVADAIKKSRTELDPAKRQADFDTANRAFWNDYPWLALHYQVVFTGMAKNVKNFVFFANELYEVRNTSVE
jgi:peptide/nickel transport system substrate-binding protein